MKKNKMLRKTLQLAIISSVLFGTAYKAHSVDKCYGYHSKGNPFVCCASGNCTWWAAKQAMDNWGISSSQLPSLRSAKYWDDDAKTNPSFSVSSTPQVNSIGVMNTSVGTYANSGHVVWITKVVDSKVSYTEMSCGSSGVKDVPDKDATKFTGGYIIYGVVLKDFWRKSDPIYSGVTKGFDAQFKLTNSSGKTISLESVALSLHDANGNFIKDMQNDKQKFSNVSIANGTTWQTGKVYTDTAYSNNGSALPPGTYRVVAKIDENSNGKWDGRHLSEQTFTILANSTGSKPVAPTGLSASASGTSITFRWNDVSSNESGFRVYRWTGSQWGSLATTSANATSYTNSGLSSNTTYFYTVCSYNSAGDSCASSYAYATTGSSGSVPSNVSVNPSSGSWTSNQNLAVTSAGATTIYYTMVNTYDGSTPYDPAYPSQSNYNGTLSGPSATFSLYGSSGQLSKSKLRFVGCNNYGCGSVSGVYSYSIDQRSTVSKPAAPGSQSAAATSSSSITLSWSDLSNNESGFTPYRWNGSMWASLGNISANSTSYVNSGLSANTTYYYYICSYNSAGESCPSNYVSATTTSSGGSSWDGKSPSGTACEQDAVTVISHCNYDGMIHLFWSNTCKTYWTRVEPNSSSYSTYGKVRRASDGLSYTTSGTGTRFTAMVYAPTGQVCVSGSINIYSMIEMCR